MEVLIFILVPVVAVAVIAFSLRMSFRKNQATWNEELQVVTPPTGAYRDGDRRVGFVELLGQIPSDVKVAAVLALVFGVMWVPSLPLVGLGVMVEADNHSPGLATFFGIAGIPLSIAHFVLGLQISKRSPSVRRLVRNISVWSIVHNVLLLGATFWANTVLLTGDHGFEACRIRNGGIAVLIYATASISYAVFAMRAVKHHRAYDEPAEDLAPFVAWPPSSSPHQRPWSP